MLHMGGCQNDGPFWGTLNIRCRSILGTQKGSIILTTTHIFGRITTSLLSPDPKPSSRTQKNVHPGAPEQVDTRFCRPAAAAGPPRETPFFRSPSRAVSKAESSDTGAGSRFGEWGLGAEGFEFPQTWNACKHPRRPPPPQLHGSAPRSARCTATPRKSPIKPLPPCPPPAKHVKKTKSSNDQKNKNPYRSL